jgi:single-strand DNA-binding protein
MSGSISKTILVGNLGKDPEIRTTQDGREIANLTIATSEKWKDKNSGEQREKTEWHKVVIFNPALAKFCGNYLRKGAKVYIEGQNQTRKWTDKDGIERYSTEVVIQGYNGTLTSLDKPQKNESTEPASYAAASSGSSEFVAEELNDDIIPF